MLNISHHNFDFSGKKLKVILEKYSDLKGVDVGTRKILDSEIHALLINCWGTFPADFVEKHIFGASKMIIARVDKRCIGLCVMSLRTIFGIKIHYIEFLLIDKEFQKCGLGSFLSFTMIRREIIKNLPTILIGRPLEIFFITPNIRVLSHTAKFASFIYPNPYLADQNGAIMPADEKTWKIANGLLKNSDKPNRVLERDGLVLKGSYSETPWLIYNNDNAPWHSKEQINVFAKKYLRYHKGEDREFMVRAHINIISLFRYLVI